MTYNYECNRLFGGSGLASVRSYIIEKCLAEGLDICIKLKGTGKQMTVTNNKLCPPTMFQTNPNKKFTSKVDGHSQYTLYDFKFVPDDDRQTSLDDYL